MNNMRLDIERQNFNNEIITFSKNLYLLAFIIRDASILFKLNVNRLRVILQYFYAITQGDNIICMSADTFTTSAVRLSFKNGVR